jgi:hypothetical protein
MIAKWEEMSRSSFPQCPRKESGEGIIEKDWLSGNRFYEELKDQKRCLENLFQGGKDGPER